MATALAINPVGARGLEWDGEDGLVEARLAEIDLTLLRSLYAVARTRSFSAAAECLAYTQPAVSQHIRRLETRLGERLVDRSTRPITLTQRGMRVAKLAESILRTASSLRPPEPPAARISEVRLATFPTAAATLVPRAIRAVNKEYPAVHAEITEAEPEDAVTLVQSGAVDLALVHDYPSVAELDLDGLACCEVLSEGFRWVLPGSGTRRTPKRLEASDLADHVWIGTRTPGPASSYNAMLTTLAARAGATPRIGLNTNDTSVAQGIAAAGLGVVLLPELGLNTLHRGVTTREPAGWSPVRRIKLIHRGGRWRSAMVEALASALCS
jgi:DNA-binding transcriptional LysR family regulator